MHKLTVTPLCPPMTGMVTEGAKEGSPSFSATKVEARTTSRVVTPKSLKHDQFGKWVFILLNAGVR